MFCFAHANKITRFFQDRFSVFYLLFLVPKKTKGKTTFERKCHDTNCDVFMLSTLHYFRCFLSKKKQKVRFQTLFWLKTVVPINRVFPRYCLKSHIFLLISKNNPPSGDFSFQPCLKSHLLLYSKEKNNKEDCCLGLIRIVKSYFCKNPPKKQDFAIKKCQMLKKRRIEFLVDSFGILM